MFSDSFWPRCSSASEATFAVRPTTPTKNIRPAAISGGSLKRSIQLNGVSGLCLTKLDVLDGLPTVRIGTAYRQGGRTLDVLPFGADAVAACEPVYEDMPGWSEPTAGVRRWQDLPANARRYLERLAELAGAPIAMVSTGADRDDTILLQHPFA